MCSETKWCFRYGGKRLRADSVQLFHWRIATALGYRHPDFLIEGMTSKQFNELLNYYNIEPFGEYRHELRSGKLLALLSEINRNEKLRSEPFSAKEFMDYLEPESERIYTEEELEAYADKVFSSPKTKGT